MRRTNDAACAPLVRLMIVGGLDPKIAVPVHRCRMNSESLHENSALGRVETWRAGSREQRAFRAFVGVEADVETAGVLAEPGDAEPAQGGHEDGGDDQDEDDGVDGVHGCNYGLNEIVPPVAGMTTLVDILPFSWHTGG